MKKSLILTAAMAALALLPCSAQYELTGVERTRLIVDSRYDSQPDQQAAAFIAPYQQQVDSLMSPIVGEADHYMEARRPESDLSNLLADILVWGGKHYGEKPDLAVYNMGGIRAALAKGTVTYGDVVDVAPFENKISFLTLTGEKLLQLFREMASVGGEGVSRGVEMVITRDGKLVSARLHGKDINPKGKYRVATLDYLAHGNDRLDAFKDKTRFVSPQDEQSNVRYIISNYFRELAAKGQAANAKVEGRIVVQDAQQPQGLKLTVLHTNDTHSTIFPLSTNLNDTLKAGRGGFLRRIALLKEERKKDPDLLLFDSGDFSQGSPYYTMFRGDVEAGLMNLMGYDAGTIGNHEFDYGMDNMARLFRSLDFPIVCANYDFTGTVLADVVKPYVVLERKGLKIGVFGLCPKLEGLVDGKNYEPIRYLDPVEKAKETVATLRAQGCDLVVCLSHLGWEIGGEDDAYMIGRTSGIDLVLGGHSHSYMTTLGHVDNADGHAVPVDQNGKHALFVGKLVLDLQQK